MKRLFHIFSAAAIMVAPLLAPLLAHARELPAERPKVAVVLSGGGAKGVAHIGALKVIEQAGIPVDIVVGTSMGAIVGGFYSIGYTPDQLEDMVLSQDWGVLLSDRTPRRRQPYSEKENDDRYQVTYPLGRRGEGGVSGLVQGTNLEMLFSDMTVGYHDSIDFHTLPIPFACIATNIVDGSQVVFEQGVLPLAMRASMAIPGFFTPVYLDDAVLVDGGLINNFPTDVARGMGADIIIGVDVQSGLRGKEELSGAAQVMRQIIEMNMRQQDYRKKVADSDVYVKVDVEGYSSQSFNLPALDTLIRRGYSSALAQYEGLLRLKHELGLAEDHSTTPRESFKALSDRGSFHVYNISFEGLSERQQRWVMRKCNIREDSDATVSKLDHCVSILGTTASHTGIYYSLRDTLGGYNLHFHMNAVKGNTVSAGVNFDTEEVSSVLVNGTFRLGRKMPMEASVTGRFGKRLAIGADYMFLVSPLSGFRLSYNFNHSDVNINSGGERLYNPTYNLYHGSASFVNTNFLRQSLRMEIGLAYQQYRYLSFLTNYRDFGDGIVDRPGIVGNDLTANLDARMWSYFAKFDYETLDSRYFTLRGTALSLGFEMFTDNFYQWKGHAPFASLALSWATAIPVSRRFSLIPGLYGRVVSGLDIPFPMQNVAGGKFFGRYMPHQLPFDGVNYMEMAPNIFLASKIQARQRIGRRHYVSGSFNYGIAADEFFAIAPEGQNYFGGSLDYGYDLRNFPLQASLAWSNITRNVGFYFQAGYMF